MKLFLTALSLLLLVGLASAESQELKTDKDKLSYSMGVATGTQMKRQSVDVDVDMFAKGLRDSVSGGKLQMTEQEIQEALMKFQQEMAAKQAEKTKQLTEINKKEGEAFLAENKKKEGVKTLPSGLQYKVITEGSGNSPKETDTVTTHYRGTLIDGTEFDSSIKRGQPATFAVKGVIKGWTEALQLMKEGSKWQLFIPSELAYGERGAGQQIGPNSALIFEVELISIKDNTEKKEPNEQKAQPKK
ncbi:MAG: FKBP-type peptidyl-prolyl cis-trans isomerase [Nitrospirota bacterium]|nr:FKBP-type peptidyl-prolyl cis-trans isomerase [Nitrospirota bacterium]